MDCYLADQIYYQDRFQHGLAVYVEEGEIRRVAPPDPETPAHRLRSRALLPGFVNAHSHAFQRAIRGRTEFREPERPGDDFWSWREKMYQAAHTLSPEDVERVSRMAFLEMLESGITTVGEFHYLHHQPTGGRYDDPNELAWRVLQAADSVGLGTVLLRVAYQRSGFQKEPNPLQARFIDARVDHTLEALEAVRSRGYRVGVTPHSVRAVDRDWLKALRDYADQHDLPFHIHVSEQPRELEECRAEHGRTPISFLSDLGALSSRFTGVHAIHLEPEEVAMLGRAQANVCSCPTTERNLGDGIVPARELQAAGVSFAFGSDSNCQIDLLEDARQLDYHERLRHLERVPLAQGRDLGQKLFHYATQGGARSLGIAAGVIEAGMPADLVAVDLDHPSVVGAPDEDLLDTLVFGATRGAVSEVWCRGRLLVEGGRHRQRNQATADFRRAMAHLC